MEVNQTSALLHRLVGRGAVVEEGQGRKLRYRLSERLYNIYHLLRRRGAGAARVRAVVDFMVHLYEGEGLVGLLERIAEEAKGLGPEERRDHFDVMAGILQGQVDRALALLEASPARTLFEPLVVALRQLAGQPVHAPPEVLEVASDLVRLVEQQHQQDRSSDEHASGSRSIAKAKPRRAGKGRAAAES
ncbi:uncharacterized protein SOCEGT47_050240 [Sorangium cellulosum]|uniref:Uncharacterized protein n=1 Tax=Sorangium cellulosum TaxID=56 RepID=A0A4P2Q5W8_SORCE|nr:hypothetical protein [Sorangium cellulosum]AUX24486.1 uncharacterized protein SOCEGT47_050240 [Sorangium cellulosum]